MGWLAGEIIAGIACVAPYYTAPDSDAGNAVVDASSTPDAFSTSEGADSAPTPDASRAIWSFHSYCGAGTGSACPTFEDCPTPPGDEVGAMDCAAPFGRCLARDPAGAGLADRIYACEPLSGPVWNVIALCSLQSCAGVDAGTCTPSDAGVDGQPCPTALERCSFGGELFVCQPSGVRSLMLDGYCDAGGGTSACPRSTACAPVDGGYPGAACAVASERCLAGTRVFVCAQR
jgi:hypothetical protein